MTLVLHEWLRASAQRHPERPAVVDGDEVYTYAELDARSDQIAQVLERCGVVRGDRVAAYVDKSRDAVAGLYGIMKAGAAYVPLDPKAPVDRLGKIAAQAGVSVLVGTASRSKRWPALIEAGAPLAAIVAVDTDEPRPVDGVTVLGTEAIGAAASEPTGVVTSDDEVAYILFTSGSTGVPKGVTISHANGGWFAKWAADTLALSPEDRLSNHAPFHFDLSVFDLYAAAYAGASVHLVPPAVSMFPLQLAEFIRSHELTVWYSVPTVLRQLKDQGQVTAGDLPTLRALVFAGEVFPTPDLTDLMTLLPHPEYWNWFGPTETNVCTAYRVEAPPDPAAGDIPIGSPIAATEALVVDEDLSPVDDGEAGELLIVGPTVCRGYWADEERTALGVIEIPTEGDVRTAYRTGDIVVRRDDGNLVFMGRRDHQIKSRGYRIELSEIETVIHSHPGVVEAAVVAVPDPAINNRLHAFVVLRDDVAPAEVVARCRERLPAYMVPGAMEPIDALPRTSNDKTDRRALVALAEVDPSA